MLLQGYTCQERAREAARWTRDARHAEEFQLKREEEEKLRAQAWANGLALEAEGKRQCHAHANRHKEKEDMMKKRS